MTPPPMSRCLLRADAHAARPAAAHGRRRRGRRPGRKRYGSAGGSLEPPGPLLTHLRTVYMAYSEYVPTRLNSLAERACFSQAPPRPRGCSWPRPAISCWPRAARRSPRRAGASSRGSCSNLSHIYIGMHTNAPLSPMKRVPGYTIPMHLGSYAPMAPMHLVEQIRALTFRQQVDESQAEGRLVEPDNTTSRDL